MVALQFLHGVVMLVHRERYPGASAGQARDSKRKCAAVVVQWARGPQDPRSGPIFAHMPPRFKVSKIY